MAAGDLQTHHLGLGRTLAWIPVVVGVAGAADVLRRGDLSASGVALLLACVALVLTAYVLGIRPAVEECPSELVVRNPLRTTRIPWSAVVYVRTSDVVVIETAGRDVRCYALPRRLRPASGSSAFGGRLLGAERPPPEAGDDMGRRLEAQAEALRVGQPELPVVSGWDPVPVTASVLAVLMVVLAVVIGVSS